MNDTVRNADRGLNRNKTGTALIRRGAQSRILLKAGIVGGGKACDDLLLLFSQERLNSLKMEIVGVADPDPNAPGISRAKDMGIFTTDDFTRLYTLPEFNHRIDRIHGSEGEDNPYQAT